MDFVTQRLVFVAFMAAINTGAYMLLYKWNIIGYYNLYRKKWMPSCSFCLFFWLAFFEIAFIITGWWLFSFEGLAINIALALGAAAISRKLI